MKSNVSKSQKPHILSYANRLLFILLGVTAIMVVVHLIFQYQNYVVYHELNGRVFEISNRVDFDDETSIPTWFAEVLFLAIAGTALVAAFVQKSRPTKALWLIIAVFGLLFSMDEAAALHEFVLQTLHLIFFQEAVPTALSNAWVLILPFVAVIGGWLAYQMYRLFPKRTTFLFITSVILFLVGAAFIDIVTSTEAKNTFHSQGILVALEESFELVGSIIMLYAIVDYLETYHAARIRNALNQLRAK